MSELSARRSASGRRPSARVSSRPDHLRVFADFAEALSGLMAGAARPRGRRPA